MRIAYLAHDVSDPAISRRIVMLRSGGAEVELLGFTRRSSAAPAKAEFVELGRTANAQFVQRLAAVAKAARSLESWREPIQRADLIVARNLEMLFLAVWARTRLGLRTPVVYESLDIHRLLLSSSAVGMALRAAEGRLLKRSATLIVSSGDFVERHFSPRYGALPPVLLLENKVLESEARQAPGRDGPRSGTPPWRIGWFGMLRCRRSLHILAGLARSNPGRVEVVIRGRVQHDAVPDFEEIVGGTPGLTFGGPYDRATELAAIYHDVDFIWAIDYFEAGGNSAWLLPNRIYEGSLYGAIPIADRAVASGRWLERKRIGVLLDEPLERRLQGFFDGASPDQVEALTRQVRDLPRSDLLFSESDCRDLVTTLARLTEGGSGAASPERGGEPRS